MMRIGFIESITWRAEMFVWILATTMPLVMLPLWLSVTRTGPVHGMDESHVRAYFLTTFIVRQLTSAWASWQINFEVRTGVLSMRLLRPVSPILSYAIETLSSIPLRSLIALPLALLSLVYFCHDILPETPTRWLLFVLTIPLAWFMLFCIQVAIGSMSFFFESSLKVSEVWTALYFVLSGYLVPPQMFPEGLRNALDWMPFRYVLAFPVEILIGTSPMERVWELLIRQIAFVIVIFSCTLLLWKKGIKRFGAFGG